MGKIKDLAIDNAVDYAKLEKEVGAMTQSFYYAYWDLNEEGTPIELSGDSLIRVKLELSLAQLMFETERLLKAVKLCRPDAEPEAPGLGGEPTIYSEVDAKNLATWTEVLFETKDLLPDGRGWERYVTGSDGKPRELRIRETADGKVYGLVDMNQLIEAAEPSDAATFLVDWAKLN